MLLIVHCEPGVSPTRGGGVPAGREKGSSRLRQAHPRKEATGSPRRVDAGQAVCRRVGVLSGSSHARAEAYPQR